MLALDILPGQQVPLLVPVLVQAGDTTRMTGKGVQYTSILITCILDYS